MRAYERSCLSVRWFVCWCVTRTWKSNVFVHSWRSFVFTKAHILALRFCAMYGIQVLYIHFLIFNSLHLQPKRNTGQRPKIWYGIHTMVTRIRFESSGRFLICLLWAVLMIFDPEWENYILPPLFISRLKYFPDDYPCQVLCLSA